MTDSLSTVEKLTEAADEASRNAAQTAKPKHAEALEAAQRLRDELSANLSAESRKQKCCRIIEKAMTQRDANPDHAAIVLGQYLAALGDAEGIRSTSLRDGSFILSTFAYYSKTMTPAQRVKALDSLVLAAKGEVDAGLVEFGKDWTAPLSVDDAEVLAELADPDAFSKYRKAQEKQAAELATAKRYADALSQAAPSLFVVRSDHPTRVTVRNHRGDIRAGGITFTGNDVTEISFDDYARAREHWFFASNVESGNLEVVNEAILVEAL